MQKTAILGTHGHPTLGKVMPGLLAIAAVVALGGCGQKGPLYLPSPTTPAPTENKAAPANATQAEEGLPKHSVK